MPRYEVKRASSKIAVDGKLDEAAWKNAGTIVFQFPWEKQTGAKQRPWRGCCGTTRIFMWATNARMPILWRFYLKRDDPTYKDDAVEIFINPDPAQSFYYGMEMNARATLYDYFLRVPATADRTGRFQRRAACHEHEGHVESDRRPGRGLVTGSGDSVEEFCRTGEEDSATAGAVWRANLNRWDGTEPNRRLSQWANSGMDTPNPHNPARFGELVFVDK